MPRLHLQRGKTSCLCPITGLTTHCLTGKPLCVQKVGKTLYSTGGLRLQTPFPRPEFEGGGVYSACQIRVNVVCLPSLLRLHGGVQRSDSKVITQEFQSCLQISLTRQGGVPIS